MTIIAYGRHTGNNLISHLKCDGLSVIIVLAEMDMNTDDPDI